jgi:hypothetical protein
MGGFAEGLLYQFTKNRCHSVGVVWMGIQTRSGGTSPQSKGLEIHRSGFNPPGMILKDSGPSSKIFPQTHGYGILEMGSPRSNDSLKFHSLGF